MRANNAINFWVVPFNLPYGPCHEPLMIITFFPCRSAGESFSPPILLSSAFAFYIFTGRQTEICLSCGRHLEISTSRWGADRWVTCLSMQAQACHNAKRGKVDLLLCHHFQSYEIKSPPFTILWFRILGIFSVENI